MARHRVSAEKGNAEHWRQQGTRKEGGEEGELKSKGRGLKKSRQDG